MVLLNLEANSSNLLVLKIVYTLFFFSYIEKERDLMESHERLLCLDYNPDCFKNLLSFCKDFLTKGEAKKLRKYTINLDCNLMKSISLTRDKKK